MSVEWKAEGKFLKFGIKTYVLPGGEKEMVRMDLCFSHIKKYEIVERVTKDEKDIRKQDGWCFCLLDDV